MTTALVLGAGGTVGMAYHAGVLRALEEVGGLRPDDADLIVGTSAGSMMGALVRSGLETEDLYAGALGEHPELSEDADESPWEAAFGGPADVVRRVLGASYVLGRSIIRVPMPPVPARIQRMFPGGFYTIANAEETMAEVMPTAWPDKPLWLVTVDVRTGRRVVLGRRNPPRTDLHTAVKASCAIPAFFTPVRVGHRTLVDGGVHSTTNVDLATKLSPDLVVVVVPMGYDTSTALRGIERVTRERANASLEREVAQARRRGARVLMIRPTAEDLAAFGGPNMMRREGNDVVARVAYESASRILNGSRAAEMLALGRETATV